MSTSSNQVDSKDGLIAPCSDAPEIPLTFYPILRTLLTEDGRRFPAKVKVMCGRTLTKSGQWWKAILLVHSGRKLQLRTYAWQYNKKQKVWKTRQKFNISPTKYSGDMIRILTVFLRESGKTFNIEAAWAQDVLRELFELRKQRESLTKQVLKNRLPKLQNAIQTFEKMLKNNAGESEFQKFLRHGCWMFGPKYRGLTSQPPTGLSRRADLLLRRYDDFSDVVELKAPNHALFTSSGEWSGELKSSISQMMRYLSDLDTNYLYLKQEKKWETLLPEGIIVIGRDKRDEKELLKIHNNFLHRIKIMTYDELLESAKGTIQTLESG